MTCVGPGSCVSPLAFGTHILRVCPSEEATVGFPSPVGRPGNCLIVPDAETIKALTISCRNGPVCHSGDHGSYANDRGLLAESRLLIQSQEGGGEGRNRTDDTRIFSLKVTISRNTHSIVKSLHFNKLTLINSFRLRQLPAPSGSRSAAELPRKARSGSGSYGDPLRATTATCIRVSSVFQGAQTGINGIFRSDWEMGASPQHADGPTRRLSLLPAPKMPVIRCLRAHSWHHVCPRFFPKSAIRVILCN